MKPVIAQSLLDGLRLYIVTRYSLRPSGSDDPNKAILVAQKKYDVTNLFEYHHGRISLIKDLTLFDQIGEEPIFKEFLAKKAVGNGRSK